MTKGGGFACGACRHHRAACHLGIVDEDSITEPCHPLAALGKGQLVQSRWQAVAPCFTPLAQGGNMHVVPCLGLELPQWLRSTMGALRSLRSSARTLLPLEHRCQGAIEPPRWWACALRQDSTPRVTARLPSRRPPGPPLRPFPCMGAEGRGRSGPGRGPAPRGRPRPARGPRARCRAHRGRGVAHRYGPDSSNHGRRGARGDRRPCVDTDHRCPGHGVQRDTSECFVGPCARADASGAGPATRGNARGGRGAPQAPSRSDRPAGAAPGGGMWASLRRFAP